MSRILIAGSGLLGCSMAIELIYNRRIPANKISIFDYSANLFAGWDYEVISGYDIPIGFHGFEFPRAKQTLDLIKKLIPDLDCFKIRNIRKLLIEGTLIDSAADYCQWPKILHDSMPLDYLDHYQSMDKSEFMETITNTSYGKLINQCASRFSDDPLRQLSFVYPWFLPNGFNFDQNSEDEGIIFQQRLRDRTVYSDYLFPQAGFQNLASRIVSELKDLGVSFYPSVNALDIIDRKSVV